MIKEIYKKLKYWDVCHKCNFTGYTTFIFIVYTVNYLGDEELTIKICECCYLSNIPER